MRKRLDNVCVCWLLKYDYEYDQLQRFYSTVVMLVCGCQMLIVNESWILLCRLQKQDVFLLVISHLVVFDGCVTSKIKRRGFSFSFSDSTCYTRFVLIFLLFPQLSLLLHSGYVQFSIVSFTLTLFDCGQEEFKVPLKYQTSCEVDHTCV